MTTTVSELYPADSGSAVPIPPDLLHDLRDGTCVAFVGAGFTAPAGLPSWRELLERIAAGVIAEDVRSYARLRLASGSSDANEEVAQILETELGRPEFEAALRRQLQGGSYGEAMRRRVELLRGIPFQAVLTTNFDGVLPGEVAGSDVYREVLTRPRTARSLFARALSSGRADWPAPVVKLHGDIGTEGSVVLSRLDYRRRLYSDVAYLGFLRSIFLYNTVLYLGFSFTDAYINQLRSETLEMLGRRPEDRPRSYAIINDVPEVARDHLLGVEGIEVLSYDTRGGSDFSGFDGILQRLHDATNPLVHFGRLLAGKRLLWVDPRPESVQPISRDVLDVAARMAGAERCRVELVTDAAEATRRLSEEPGWDLVVSHWGHGTHDGPTALQVLRHIRTHDIRVPLMVFATPDHADENRRELLRAGGIGFYHSWDGALAGLEHVFARGTEAG